MTALDDLAPLLGSDRFRRQTLADGSGIVLDMEAMRVLSLNRTGMHVLDAVARGETRVEALERHLTEAFEVDAETAARDIEELLEQIETLLIDPSAC